MKVYLASTGMDFADSPEFYQGQDFTAEMAESMNMIKKDTND